MKFVAIPIFKIKSRMAFLFFYKATKSFRKKVSLSDLADFRMKATKNDARGISSAET